MQFLLQKYVDDFIIQSVLLEITKARKYETAWGGRGNEKEKDEAEAEAEGREMLKIRKLEFI